MTTQEGDVPKEILGDRYHVQQQLGKKAGRRTLLACDLQTQQLVVVKLLSFSDDFEWNDLKLFEREAETLKALFHPAIPRYLDYFELDSPNGKGFALVQSYIEAKSLDVQLKAGRSLSEAEVKQLAKAILQILIYLHNRQPAVIHRDIKPSNILLTNRSGNSVGEVYLVDFGSVQTLAVPSSTMTIVGTYGYMPPEQFSGRATPSSDLYSLGTTLIYLVTGQHPADLPQTDLKIEFEQAANISPGFSRWLQKITQPMASKRFASAQEALQALEQAESYTDNEATHLSVRKPFDSQVILSKNADSLEIIIPSVGLFSRVTFAYLFFSIVMFICTNLFLYIRTITINSGFLITSSSLFVLFAFFSGIYFISRSFISAFGVMRFSIDRQHVSLIYELSDIKHYPSPPSPRENIFIKINTNYLYFLSIRVKKQNFLTIGVGKHKYELSTNSIFPLTPAEVEWLADEISKWLGLPVIRD